MGYVKNIVIRPDETYNDKLVIMRPMTEEEKQEHKIKRANPDIGIFSGSPTECEAFLRLYDKGYMDTEIEMEE